MRRRPPCVRHEDSDLLVVWKPSGWNTHSPSPHAGEGIYDWLRNREPEWASLATIHRLDKGTSGWLVFSKSATANRSLTEQFARREVEKRYVLISDRKPTRDHWTAESYLARRGDIYVAVAAKESGDFARTRFQVEREVSGRWWIEARPETGRTHQIRVHAASSGCPILGDPAYGGRPAARLHLHAAGLKFRHPSTGECIHLEEPPDFSEDSGETLRKACLVPEETNAWRVLNGAADGLMGVFVERFGSWDLASTEGTSLPAGFQSKAGGVYHRILERRIRETQPESVSPRHLSGEPVPDRFTILENGVRFEICFLEGYSVGLFLDQRDNRRRWMTGYVGPGFHPGSAAGETGAWKGKSILNTFAYTCGFSVAAALGGATTTSLDLSPKYLEWGRRNFRHNGLDPGRHDFVHGDAFDWMRRWSKKGRRFDGVILDPPTFSRSRERGDFRVESDYGRLVESAGSVLTEGGILLASTNAARLSPERFLGHVREGLDRAGWVIAKEHYAPQPPDFPVTREEPAYLKTVWVEVRRRR